ncbi:MAG: TlpA family protein disulfide reductase [Vulcanimicrobiaceae bacterium]
MMLALDSVSLDPRLAGACALALALAAGSAAVAAGPPQIGASAPAATLTLAKGGDLSLASLRGRAVYLNFFASWCGPCNEEAPSIAKLARTFGPKGLVTVGVDEQESDAKALGFAKKYDLPYAIAEDSGSVAAAYGVSFGLPVHVFIDRRGKLSTYRVGEMQPQEIQAAIERALR